MNGGKGEKKMKLVGVITDEEELDEIEDIAKVFIIEQRIKQLSKTGRSLSLHRHGAGLLPARMILHNQMQSHPLASVRGFT